MDAAEAQVCAENGSAKRRRIIDVRANLFEAKLAAVAGELGREVHVFVNPAARNSLNQKPISDEPDDFYEFTTEDYVRLFANKKEEKILKTKKLRDAELAAYRAKITKAVIKVQFPDDYLIQTTFQPSETISVLMDLLKKVIAQPDVPFYIYTTPPKKIITDLTKDFYSANLVPGALVRFHYDVPEEAEKGPFLRDDIMALCDLHSLLETKEAEKPVEPEPLAAEPPPEPSNSRPVAKKDIKPKWLRRRSRKKMIIVASLSSMDWVDRQIKIWKI